MKLVDKFRLSEAWGGWSGVTSGMITPSGHHCCLAEWWLQSGGEAKDIERHSELPASARIRGESIVPRKLRLKAIGLNDEKVLHRGKENEIENPTATQRSEAIRDAFAEIGVEVDITPPPWYEEG